MLPCLYFEQVFFFVNLVLISKDMKIENYRKITLQLACTKVQEDMLNSLHCWYLCSFQLVQTSHFVFKFYS